MDEERFEQLIEVYGGESARWPQSERAPALRYLAATASAHRTRGQARELDRLLDAWSPDRASEGLLERIAASLPAIRAVRPRDLWLSGAGLAAACVVGLMVGAGFGVASLGSGTIAHEGDTATVTVTAALDGTPAAAPEIDEGES